ncbi:hypothetical protein HVPorG_04695 (plasmid) [Roseomonas mucosa]|uniref:Helix-turn-helix domain-containing protein n=2 Tax=Bacteria TaxID=2 RepID=A0A4Y1MRQ1_9PROT|nr:hypothetical protein [Roseomonas mucosa]APT48399.1 hypothetical protein BSA145_21265 [Bacillus safensis]AWV20626.1 hypothetical protein RADP37_04695 [Roseomonas mucosa]QDJ12324.1 hypothetical protein HVPorG_04695 [Roseomonas mucosa]
MGSPDRIPLSQLPRELRSAADILDREGKALQGVKYRTLYGAVLDGMIPAEQHGGRWYVQREDLPKIAQALGASGPATRGRPVREAA